MKRVSYIFFASAIALFSCKNSNNTDAGTDTTSTTTDANAPANIPYTVVNMYPHDTAAYTEGLFYKDGFLYESTGGDQSFIVKRTVQDEKPVKKLEIPKPIFGEGIIELNGKLYELTYREHKVFVYDAKTWNKIKEFTWPQEGWGMTTDGKSLILSTGDSNLYYVNPDNFQVEKIVGVTDNYGPKGDLNELEYVDGIIYSNVFETNNILKIDPSSGKVLGIIDLTDINQKNGVDYTPGSKGGNDVLNGIAYNPTTKTFYITGKNWPKIFEVRL